MLMLLIIFRWCIPAFSTFMCSVVNKIQVNEICEALRFALYILHCVPTFLVLELYIHTQFKSRKMVHWAEWEPSYRTLRCLAQPTLWQVSWLHISIFSVARTSVILWCTRVLSCFLFGDLLQFCTLISAEYVWLTAMPLPAGVSPVTLPSASGLLKQLCGPTLRPVWTCSSPPPSSPLSTQMCRWRPCPSTTCSTSSSSPPVSVCNLPLHYDASVFCFFL